MDKLSILNNKKARDIRDRAREQWGAEIQGDHVFLENTQGKLYIVTRDFGNIDTAKLRVQSVGCYFGEVCLGGIRLSIEGSQLVGPGATKNIIDITDEEAKAWLAGSDLPRTGEEKGFIIIRNNQDYLGCGTYSKGRDKIQNYVPKARRTSIIA